MATINMQKMAVNERAQSLFISGWENEGGIMDDVVDGNPAPWCAPWTYKQGNLEIPGETFEECGAAWWNMNRGEIEYWRNMDV